MAAMGEVEVLRARVAALEEELVRVKEERKKAEDESFQKGFMYAADTKKERRRRKKAMVEACTWEGDKEKEQKQEKVVGSGGGGGQGGQGGESEKVKETRKQRKERTAAAAHNAAAAAAASGMPVTANAKKGRKKKDAKRHQSRLRYMDEFMRLTSREFLLELQIFPNAKELAESFAGYNAVRNHMVGSAKAKQREQWEAAIREQEERCDTDEDLPYHQILDCFNTCSLEEGLSVSDKRVAMLVVGDGSTPRIACMTAIRTKWTCISVDPQIADALAKAEKKGGKAEELPWMQVDRVLCLPNLIQDIDLAEILREEAKKSGVESFDKMIVVLMHSHVSLKRALEPLIAAQWAGSFLGVLACPCCNWAEAQSRICEELPMFEYEDPNMGTAKNRIRIWRFVGDQVADILTTLKDREEALRLHKQQKNDQKAVVEEKLEQK